RTARPVPDARPRRQPPRRQVTFFVHSNVTFRARLSSFRMSTSLREQLLKAGLVSEKQVKQAEKQVRKESRGASPADARQKQAAAQQAQAAKAARDREINRRKAEKAEAKAREAQVRQIVEQHRLPSGEDGAPYFFKDGAFVRRIHVDAEQRRKVIGGELAIARYGKGFALLPLSAAARVRDRDPRAIVEIEAGDADRREDEDDAYRGFEVPDDLLW